MSEQEKKKGVFGRLFGGNKGGEAQSTHNAAQAQADRVEPAANEQAAAENTAPPQDALTEDTPSQAEDTISEHAASQDAPAESSAPSAPAPAPAPAGEEEPEESPEKISENGGEKKSWFQRLKSGLTKSSSKLSDGITSVFTKRKLDDETLQDLEDLLIQSDLGVETALRITDALSASRYNKEISPQEVREFLAQEVENVLKDVAAPLAVNRALNPHVMLMVGVNGAGKTTTIGKLAKRFSDEGNKVMLAAGDTFRAAAIDQLKIWGERTNSPVITKPLGSDAASLAFDAMEQAQKENMDVLMIDTAGRLQNKANLMAELEKVVRVIKKINPDAPHSVLLILDATTGQNALSQVEIFQKSAGVTGLIMTKLDGTARGGILVAIAAKYGLPVHAIGVGESVEDLQAFDPKQFAEAIALSE